jgi:hypothetical protein
LALSERAVRARAFPEALLGIPARSRLLVVARFDVAQLANAALTALDGEVARATGSGSRASGAPSATATPASRPFAESQRSCA